MDAKLPSGIPQLKYAFGLQANVQNAASFVDDHTIIYCCGGNIVIYNTETKVQKFISCHEKSTKTMAIAISPNKRYVAVGEKLPDKAVVTIHDIHLQRRKKTLVPQDITVRDIVDIAFSPDSKYLAVQGGGAEFILAFFSWEKGKQLACAKTSANNTDVTQIRFNPSDSTQISVIGVELFKIFRYSENTLKSSLQLKIEPHEFTCHAWIRDDALIAGTRAGKWFVIENYEVRMECDLLSVVSQEIENDENRLDEITACAATGKYVLLACGPGLVHVFERQEENAKNTNENTSKTVVCYRRVKELRVPNENAVHPIGMASGRIIISDMCISPSLDSVLCCTSNSQMYHQLISSTDLSGGRAALPGLAPDDANNGHPQNEVEVQHFTRVGHQFHQESILSMDVCCRKPIVVTCSTDHSIRVWNYETNTLELFKEFAEEAYSIALHPSGLYISVGFSDKLRIMNLLIDDIRTVKEFPIRGCRVCSFSNGGHLLAAVHGNTIQVYSSTSFENISNLKGHNGKIRSLFWVKDDRKLVSCGMDGAVYEWDPDTGKRVQENVMKSCSYTGVATTTDGRISYVVGSDMKIKEMADSSIQEEIAIPGSVMNTICLAQSGRMLFCGLANGALRSLRMPLTNPADYQDYVCHSARINDMRIAAHDQYVITVSDDASIMIWRVQDREGRGLKMDREFAYAEEILITKSDLEEKNAITVDLKTRIDELKMENEYQLRLKEMNHNERLKELTEKFIQEMESLKTKNQVLRKEKERDDLKSQERMQETIEAHNSELEALQASANQKLMVEYEKLQEVQSTTQKMQEDYEARVEELQYLRQKDVDELTQYFESRLAEQAGSMDTMKQELREQNMESEITKRLIEEDADREILEMKINYESRLREERETNQRLRGESGILRKKFSNLQKEIDEQKEDLRKNQLEVTKLNGTIKNLEKDVAGLKKEITERDETIQEKERRIYDLKKKNQELEKFKFVLDYKIKELKKQIEPRERDIKNYKDQIQEMEAELERFHKQNTQLELSVAEMKQKRKTVENELAQEKQITRDAEGALRRLKTDIFNCVACVQEPKLLKTAIVALHKKHIQEDRGAEASGDADIQREFARQREHLERSVQSLRHKLTKNNEIHRIDYLRIMQENVTLINEINSLRRELRLSRLRINDLEATLGINRKRSENVRLQFNEVSRSKPNPMLELELGETNRMLQAQREIIIQMHEERVRASPDAVAATTSEENALNLPKIDTGKPAT